MEYVYLIVGLILLIELIVFIVRCYGSNGADILWYLCRPFNIPCPLFIGLVLRVILCIVSAHFLTMSLTTMKYWLQ